MDIDQIMSTLKSIQSRHYEYGGTNTDVSGEAECGICCEPWPCPDYLDTAYLIEAFGKEYPRHDFASHRLSPEEYDEAMREDVFDVLPRWNQ